LARAWVASFARPGGNVTGLSQQSSDLAGKRLGMLRGVVPGLRRLKQMLKGHLNCFTVSGSYANASTSEIGRRGFKQAIEEDIVGSTGVVKGR
jgi:putative ABC transport system substrate-binding protein